MPGSRPTAGTDWARFVMYQQGDMKEMSNDFWYSISSGTISSGFDYAAAVQAWYTSVITAWSNAVSADVNFRGAYGEFNDGTGTIGTDYYLDTPGTITGGSVPEDVAVVVQKITANHNRYARGRWYFGGASITNVNGSYLDSAGHAFFTALAIVLKTTFLSGGVTFAPAHFSPHTQLLYPIVNDPVVSLLGTKRRRRGPF